MELEERWNSRPAPRCRLAVLRSALAVPARASNRGPPARGCGGVAARPAEEPAFTMSRPASGEACILRSGGACIHHKPPNKWRGLHSQPAPVHGGGGAAPSGVWVLGLGCFALNSPGGCGVVWHRIGRPRRVEGRGLRPPPQPCRRAGRTNAPRRVGRRRAGGPLLLLCEYFV